MNTQKNFPLTGVCSRILRIPGQTLTVSSLLLLLVTAITGPIAGHASESAVPLQHANINLSDRASLQNGAKLFVNYCLSCHSAGLMRYERMADDLGIDLSIVQDNMMFTTDKIGNQMIASMSEKDGKAWFGKSPPDLSVISRARRPDYIYTYLVSFYKDPTTVTGWNNAVLENAAMPHVMYDLQGTQVLAHHDESAGSDEDDSHGEDHGGMSMFEMETPGSMSTAEFNKSMQDVTNFLAYMAEPAALKRVSLGFWVMSFLGILLVLTWLLKKEYWRDVYGEDDNEH